MENKVTIKNDDDEKKSNKLIFAQNLAFLRKKINLSQKELAEKLQISNKNISKWENAETIPDVFTIKKIANIFNVSIDTLVSPITKENKIAIKTQNVIPFRWKFYLMCLINAIIFLLTCITFYMFKSMNVNLFPPRYVFIYMLPIMDLSIFIFICIAFKTIDPISLSILGWLLTICFYISYINIENIEYIFFITIGYQVIIPIITRLINSRKIIEINKAIINKLKKLDNTDFFKSKNNKNQETIITNITTNSNIDSNNESNNELNKIIKSNTNKNE